MIGDRPLRICITGPTATGKTDAAVAVCRAIRGEVVSMDSMQIYQGLSIGTAKPTQAEMGGVPHHLLSFAPPQRAYTVAEYQRDARTSAADIAYRGRIPVFCGGTGLYLQAVSRPLTFAAAHGAEGVREALQREAAEPGGPETLYARLLGADPASAERLHPGNLRRVIRALEVQALTGEPMSARRAEWDAEPEERWLIFALTFLREALYARIDARVDRMIAQGLEEEVRGLMDSVPLDAQAMQAIGYRDMVQVIRGESTLEDAIDRMKRNSRRYAKRQLTWLRRDPRVRWVDVSAFESADLVAAFLIDQIRQEMQDETMG